MIVKYLLQTANLSRPGLAAFFLLLMALTGYSTGLRPYPDKKARTLKILTYNIHHANPPSKPGVIDIPAIVKVIRSSGADLVALQEIDVRNERSGRDIDQAAELGRLTGMHHFFAKGIDYAGGEYGIAILSRYPIIHAERLALPLTGKPGAEPRTLAIVTVEPFKGKRLRFANTHLDLFPEIRKLQADFIVKELGKESSPVIFCGDLNAVPGSEVIEVFDQFFTHRSDDGPTSPQINPKRRIDYIMFRPAEAFGIIRQSVIDEPYASDHLPVFTELRWK